MDLNLDLLSIQNPWWSGRSLKFDPVLRDFYKGKFKLKSDIFKYFELDKDGLSILRGARGTGKTTLMKLLVRKLIEKKNIDPENIFYYSCVNLDTYEQLNELIKIFLDKRKNNKKRKYLFIDEISLIKDWQKGINFLQKAKKIMGATVIVSSAFCSEKDILLKNVKEINPGFFEYKDFVEMLDLNLYENLREDNFKHHVKKLDYYFDMFLLTGGLASGLGSFKKNRSIEQKVYEKIILNINADIAKIGRDVNLFRQIMERLLIELGQPLGYKTIAKKTKAKTHLTVAEYLKILESMQIVKTVCQADNKGKATSRKAKKVYFNDPFFFWLFYAYVYGSLDSWAFSREKLHDDKIFSALIENIIFNHLDKDKEKEITFWRDNVHKKEINFLIRRSKNVEFILNNYGEEVTEDDIKLLRKKNFQDGIIITKDMLELKGKIKKMPLLYFLLFF